MTHSRRWQFHLGTFAIACGLLAIAMLVNTIASAKPAVVTTRDGQRFEGDVTESDTEVVIDIRGVKTVIPRANALRLKEAFPDSRQVWLPLGHYTAILHLVWLPRWVSRRLQEALLKR